MSLKILIRHPLRISISPCNKVPKQNTIPNEDFTLGSDQVLHIENKTVHQPGYTDTLYCPIHYGLQSICRGICSKLSVLCLIFFTVRTNSTLSDFMFPVWLKLQGTSRLEQIKLLSRGPKVPLGSKLQWAFFLRVNPLINPPQHSSRETFSRHYYIMHQPKLQQWHAPFQARSFYASIVLKVMKIALHL